MSLPPPSGSSGLHLRVLGFPVRIGPSFLVVLAFLGYTTPLNVPHLVAWIVIGALAILVHELGHALVARTTGAEPEIDLYGFGGVTTYTPVRPPTRARTLAITLAGPLVGVAIGLAIYFGVPGDSLDPFSFAAYARKAAIWVNLAWGVLNLLPVLPLDGGQAVVELLPGPLDRRRRIVAVLSIVIAVAGVLWALRTHNFWTAAVAAYFAMSNFALARGTSDTGAPPPPPPPRDAEHERTALWLLDQGHADRARHLVETADVDLAVHGLVMAFTGRPHVGRDAVLRAYQSAPMHPLRVECLLRLLVAEGAWADVTALLDSPSAAVLPSELLTRAREAAIVNGRG